MAASIFVWPGMFSSNGSNIAFAVGQSATIEIDGIATTSTTGFTLQNVTPATAGATMQNSPRLVWSGTAWNSVGTVSETDSWAVQVEPQTAAGATNSNLRFYRSVAGGAYANVFSITNGGGLFFNGLIGSYNGISTAGWGVPAIQAAGRTVAATNATVASVAAYTVGAADGSFYISANVNVTATTAAAMTVTCVYTDETNTSRTLTLGFTQLSGATLLTSITNVTGTGPYESIPYHIRCKAATSITIATAGTVTGITYNVEGFISQVS